jgi:hypothetical protein
MFPLNIGNSGKLYEYIKSRIKGSKPGYMRITMGGKE